MAKLKVYGRCRVCGSYGELSEEHVPPQRAFNSMPFVELTFEQTLSLGPEDVPKGPKRQGGVRFHSLCRQCNNDLGSWYAPAFVRWCYEGMYILERSGGNPKLIYAHHVYPLRIIKQIIAMFFSVNRDEFRETPTGRELSWLLRNPEEKGLPPDVRFYAYFNLVGQLRYFPIASLSRFDEGIVTVFSEITYPPFGYVMALGTDPPDSRLFDITHFAWFELDDARAMFLDLPVLPTYMGNIPGDYRKLQEILDQGKRSDEIGRGTTEVQPQTAETQMQMLEGLIKAAQLHKRYRGG